MAQKNHSYSQLTPLDTNIVYGVETKKCSVRTKKLFFLSVVQLVF